MVLWLRMTTNEFFEPCDPPLNGSLRACFRNQKLRSSQRIKGRLNI